MTKKLLLSLCLILSAVTRLYAYDFSYEFGGHTLYFNVTDTSAYTCEVTSGDDLYSGDIIIPSTVEFNGNSFTVTDIGKDAFSRCEALETVIIPESVTAIGYAAFNWCINLKSVELPSSLVKIGMYAFSSCRSLTSVTIPETVTFIGADAFNYCESLEAFYGKYASADNRCLIMGDNLIAFAPYDLTEYSVPDNVKTIGESVFQECKKLVKITLPETVTTIGSCAFESCTNLESVSVSNNLQRLEPRAFYSCNRLAEFTIPETVTYIGQGVFFECQSLREITIPESVTTINESVLCRCTNLRAIYSKYSTPDNRCLIIDGVLNSFAGYGITQYTIPESVNTIGALAFSDFTDLTTVYIPETVTKINYSAFENCAGIQTFYLPESVTHIAEWAFSQCPGLTSFFAYNPNPDNITMGEHVFYALNKDCTLYVPKGSVELYAAADQWKEFAHIEEMPSYTEVGLKYEFTDESQTAYRVSGYTEELPADVVIPPTYNGLPVVEIGEEAFRECEIAKNVKIPNTVTTIANTAFYWCWGLTSIEIPNSVTYIGSQAFNTCYQLRAIEIPNSVTTIGWRAFFECQSLFVANIPESVTYIGAEAFSRCGFHCLYVYNDNPSNIELENDVFWESPTSECTLYVPKGSKQLYAVADQWKDFGNIKEFGPLTEVGLRYEFTDDDHIAYRVIGYNDDLPADVNIPPMYNGLPVVDIRAQALWGCEVLTSLTIPESISAIGDYAFYGCDNLPSVEIPNSVNYIGIAAFAGCKNLAAFYGKYASEDNRYIIIDGILNSFAPAGLTSYDIPNDVTTIGHASFSACRELTSVVMPNSVSSIIYEAFAYCSGLESIYVYNPNPANVELWNDIFIGVPTETCVLYVPRGSKALYEVADQWRDFRNIVEMGGEYNEVGLRYEFTDDSLTSYKVVGHTDQLPANVSIPETHDGLPVVEIDEYAFAYCSWMSSVEIPSSVTSIGKSAFTECTALTSVDIPNSVTSIDEYAFLKCSNLATVTIPDNLTSLGKQAFTLCESLTSFYGTCVSDDNRCIILNGEIKAFAPAGLTSYSIPNTVTSIGPSAFLLCSDLLTVEIPNSVTTIGEDAFVSCSNLISVKIPNSVEAILWYAFSRCSSLTSVEIPNSITYLFDGTFSDCSSLTSVVIPNSVYGMGHTVFCNCSSLTTVEIPSSIEKIWDGDFADCSSLASIYVNKENPSDIELGNNVFNGVPFETCILYVPNGSKALYEVADQWRDFRNIVEMDATLDMNYDGRWISLMIADPGKTIYYTLDGSEPTAQSEVYTGPVDVGGLGIVRAVAASEGFTDCEYLDYEIPAYYNGYEALIGHPGKLSMAFNWIDHSEIANLMVRGEMGEADWECLRSLPSLQNLDLFEVFADFIPNYALAGSSIRYVSMPREDFEVGEYLFDRCEHLCAIRWNATMTPLSNDAVAGIYSPNVLLYVDDESLAPSLIANVIVNDHATSITLSDGHPFYCPLSFRADSISYTHTYTQQTPIGGCAGWETLALPFDVQRIIHEGKGEVKPFPAATDSDRPFWLYEMSGDAFVPAERIMANQPYIVSFPNNDEYSEEYILAGNITFESTYCDVPETWLDVAEGGDVKFVPTFARVPRSERVYALNIYDERLTAGSCFLSDYRDVQPFEAYLTSDHGTMRAPILTVSQLMNAPASLPTIPTADAPKEYYTIQGIKVDNPQPGSIYIVKQGGKVTKTLIR